MAETGHILTVESDYIVVRFPRTDACGKCGACSLGANSSDALLTIRGTYNASPGDSAVIELSEAKIMGASLLAYGVPLIGLLIGLFAGPAAQRWLSLPGSGDMYAAIGAVALTSVAWLAMRLLNPIIAKHSVFEPRVIRVMPARQSDETSEQ